jgi:hypothetical protein
MVTLDPANTYPVFGHVLLDPLGLKFFDIDLRVSAVEPCLGMQ